MKIKIGGRVFLQNYELDYIVHDVPDFPASITDEVLDEHDTFFIKGPVEALRFGCIFEKPENVKWLMAQSWIVNYDDYATMPLADIENLYENLKSECLMGIEEFNAQDEGYRDAHFEEENDRFNRFEHEIISIGTLIKAYKGEITFVLPSCYKGKIIPGTTKATNIHKKKLSFFHLKAGAH